jgi:hypothetical protein
MHDRPLQLCYSGTCRLAQAALSLLLMWSVSSVAQDRLEFPADAFLYSVTGFGAIPNDAGDDTAAIQAALDAGRYDANGQPYDDYFGRAKTLYFPAGVYRISDTLDWIGCCMQLQGQGPSHTIIRLIDNAPGFGTAAQPKALLRTPAGNMSFRQNIFDLALEVGSGNPGANALDWIANNRGALRNLRLTAAPGSGRVGLSLERQWPGPALIENLTIEGFDVGIRIEHAEYGPTFDGIALTGQRSAGIENSFNTLAIRGLTSTNGVPAIRTTRAGGHVILLDAALDGGNVDRVAIENLGHLYARNVSASGYRAAIRTDSADVPGLSIGEYVARGVRTLFPSPQRSLGLPIAAVPGGHDNTLANWQRVSPTFYGDVTAIQSAMNAGRATVYFPAGGYFSFARNVITVPATVRRIVGLGSFINRGPNGGIVFRVIGDTTEPLVIEQFGYGIALEHASPRTVVVRHAGLGSYVDEAGSGDLHLVDVGTDALTLPRPKRVWARQLNIEGNFPMIDNAAADLWILGMKTEGLGRVALTRGTGRTEFLGTLLYPAATFSLVHDRTAFVNDNAALSVIFSGSSYVPEGFYEVFVREIRGSETRVLTLADVGSLRLPLYAGFSDDILLRDGFE